MTFAAFMLIFLSAGMHASWNMIAKRSHMNLAFYSMLDVVAVLTGAWIWFRLPLNISDLTLAFYIAVAGSAFGEGIYCLGLIMAYRTMDMSAAYPMMRSLPLLFTALFTALCGFGKPLSLLAIIGMATVFAGCVVMPLNRFSDFRLSNYLDRKIAFVLMAALGTTIYTICDSEAQVVMRSCAPNVSKTMISCTYYELRHIMVLLPIGTLALALPSGRKDMLAMFKTGIGPALLAGVLSGVTYILVLMAMIRVDNVSYVQAFRQLGLVIGMLEGFFILKERCTLTKVLGIVLIVSGLVMTVIDPGVVNGWFGFLRDKLAM